VHVLLDGNHLTLPQLVTVARDGATVELEPAARAHMQRCRDVVEEVLAGGTAQVYGFTTGVGVRRRVHVPADAQRDYGRRAIADHQVATGPLASETVVRATMVRLANGLAKGTPGVRPELAELVITALNERRTPAMRVLGSAGQSDLGPMADLAAGLTESFELQPGEAHALFSNSAFSTALSALALDEADRLLDAATVCGALDYEAFAANVIVLANVIGNERPHAGLVRAQSELRSALVGSRLCVPPPRNHHDPLSFRNLATILGTARDAVAYARPVIDIELNASQENPMVDLEGRRLISTANYEMLPLSNALDVVRLGLAPVLSSANERLVKLLQTPFSGLSDGLEAPGSTYGTALSEMAWPAQAHAAEAVLLAQPVSTVTASTSLAEGVEDRMSLAPLSARRTSEMVALGGELLTIGLVVAAQAVELRGTEGLGRVPARTLELVRSVVPFTGPGDSVTSDVSALCELVLSGAVGALLA
jgi:histidine ammonia-lyase